jgi:hypothetical protein
MKLQKLKAFLPRRHGANRTIYCCAHPAFRKIIAINKLTKGAPDSKVQITALRNGKPVKVVETRSLLAGELSKNVPNATKFLATAQFIATLLAPPTRN